MPFSLCHRLTVLLLGRSTEFVGAINDNREPLQTRIVHVRVSHLYFGIQMAHTL